jgi:uncharacterized protein (TIGR03382 family)
MPKEPSPFFMKPTNPYEPPRAITPSEPAVARLRMLFGSIVAVFATALIGGALGALIGAALGVFLPSYYRSVFAGGMQPGFDPVAVGIGQGLTQGVGGGAAVGVVLVALFYWRQSRRRP